MGEDGGFGVGGGAGLLGGSVDDIVAEGGPDWEVGVNEVGGEALFDIFFHGWVADSLDQKK